jgi:MOSC domain-containing protein YiiM
MTQGAVESLFITTAMSEPMIAKDVVQAIAGQGLEGDRYLLATGTYSKKPSPDRQITLVEAEILDWLREDHGHTVRPEECRRNIVTRGITLNPLVGRTIAIGQTRLYVHRLCQPCRYIEKLLDQPGLYETWWDKGGIRCEILTGGEIRLGDTVTIREDGQATG